MENIERQFKDKYRPHYEATKIGDKQLMDDWKKDVRKNAKPPKENTEAVLKLEDELWNS